MINRNKHWSIKWTASLLMVGYLYVSLAHVFLIPQYNTYENTQGSIANKISDLPITAKKYTLITRTDKILNFRKRSLNALINPGLSLSIIYNLSKNNSFLTSGTYSSPSAKTTAYLSLYILHCNFRV